MPKLHFQHIRRKFKEVKVDGEPHEGWSIKEEEDSFSVSLNDNLTGTIYKLSDGEHAVFEVGNGNMLVFEIIKKEDGTYLKYDEDTSTKLRRKLNSQIKKLKKEKGLKLVPKRIGVLKAYKKDDYYKRIYNV